MPIISNMVTIFAQIPNMLSRVKNYVSNIISNLSNCIVSVDSADKSVPGRDQRRSATFPSIATDILYAQSYDDMPSKPLPQKTVGSIDISTESAFDIDRNKVFEPVFAINMDNHGQPVGLKFVGIEKKYRVHAEVESEKIEPSEQSKQFIVEMKAIISRIGKNQPHQPHQPHQAQHKL